MTKKNTNKGTVARENKIQVTDEGLKALREELNELKNSKRPRVVERVSYARDQGDLSENSDYISGKEELNFVDGRIAELEEVLAHVTVVDTDSSTGGKAAGIQIGNKVTVKLDSSTQEFHVVGEWEADPKQKKISHESPLGKALLNKKVGDIVEVDAPAGKIKYTIVKIH